LRESIFSEPIADGEGEASVPSVNWAGTALSREIPAAIRDLSAN
jgi:hypothetical protein